MKKEASQRSRALRVFLRDRWAVFALLLLAFIILSCVIVPMVWKYSYREIDLDILFAPISAEHPLGTDSLGRDMLARMTYGGRYTLKITFLATAIAAVFGGVIGVVSGYFGGTFDFIVMRVVDSLASIPSLLLAIVTECALGWGGGNFVYGLAIAAIAPFAKLTRAATLEISSSEYIEASRALGARHIYVIKKHILHNVMPVFITQIVTCLADTLITCTILGYLSIGINPPTPEWGALFDGGKAYINKDPLLTFLPVAAIVLTTVSLNLVGNGLRDAFSVSGGEG